MYNHAAHAQSAEVNKAPAAPMVSPQAGAVSDSATPISSDTSEWAQLGADTLVEPAVFGESHSALSLNEILGLSPIHSAARDLSANGSMLQGAEPQDMIHRFQSNSDAAVGSHVLQSSSSQAVPFFGVPFVAGAGITLANENGSTSRPCTEDDQDPFEHAMRTANFSGSGSLTAIDEIAAAPVEDRKPQDHIAASREFPDWQLSSNSHQPHTTSLPEFSTNFSNAQHTSHTQLPTSTAFGRAESMQNHWAQDRSHLGTNSLQVNPQGSVGRDMLRSRLHSGAGALQPALQTSRLRERSGSRASVLQISHASKSQGNPSQALVGRQESHLLKLLHSLAGPALDSAAGPSSDRLATLKKINSLQGVVTHTQRFRSMQRSHIEVICLLLPLEGLVLDDNRPSVRRALHYQQTF